MAAIGWPASATTRGLAAELKISPVLLSCVEQASLPALQEGAVLEVLVKEGAAVGSGAPIVHVDDRSARLRKDKAELEYKIASKKARDLSAVELAQTEVKVAGAGLQRALDSRKKFPDTPSQAEVDELELRLAQSKQHLERATSEVELAELAEELAEKTLEGATFDWERFIVRSPIEGIVVEVFANPGDWVRPGQQLARVIRTDRLRAEGHVKREQITGQLNGRAVEFVLENEAGGSRKYRGKIVFVSVEVDPNDGHQRIVAEIENSRGELGPGLRGQLIIRD